MSEPPKDPQSYAMGWNDALDACIAELRQMQQQDAKRLADRIWKLRNARVPPP